MQHMPATGVSGLDLYVRHRTPLALAACRTAQGTDDACAARGRLDRRRPQLQDSFLVASKRQLNADSRAALRGVYERLTGAGTRHLHYLAGEDLLADDGEGTVDSSHPTDLGFMRQAVAFEKALRPLLAATDRQRAGACRPGGASPHLQFIKLTSPSGALRLEPLLRGELRQLRAPL